uniref:Ankyrin-1 n=1 Tax=Cacopsylla melanoneura TaxID=428564 RepID=A0A8D8YWX2_9HEMI
MANVHYQMIAAVCRGDLPIVEEYVSKYGLGYVPEWSNGYVLLQNSVERGHKELSKFLLEKGSLVNVDDSSTATPLHHAVRNGDIEMVQLLIDRGADVNATDNQGSTPLHHAAHCKNLALCKLQLQHGATIDALNQANKTPLIIAIERNSTEIVDFLISQGACSQESLLHVAVNFCKEEMVFLILKQGPDVNGKDSKGRTPLYIGVERGKMTIIEILMKQGANVNISDLHGKMPLHVAAEKGNEKIIECLLKNGALVDPKVTSNSQEGLTPLFLAVIKGSLRSVILLLNSGSNVNVSDKNGKMPIHVAAEKGYVEILECLLKHGSTVDPKIISDSQIGLTPLLLAVQKSCLTGVSELLKAGANPNLQYTEGQSALSQAVINDDFLVIQELLNYNLEINNESNREALYRAAVQRYSPSTKAIIDALVEYGFILDAKHTHDEVLMNNSIKYNYSHIIKQLLNYGAKTKSSYLHAAVNNSYSEIADMFIEYGATVTNDLLHIAVVNSDTEMVQLLLNHGADPNFSDDTGKSALHLCVDRDQKLSPPREANDNKIFEISKLLIDFGANVNNIDKCGQTVLHMAIKKENTFLIKNFFLMNLGTNIDIIDGDGHSVLNLAVLTKNLEIIREILKYKPDVNNKSNRKSLDIAVCNGSRESVDIEIIETLIGYGFTIEHADDENLLYCAVVNGYLAIVEDLLKKGGEVLINILYKTKSGTMKSILEVAILEDYYKMTALLIKHGAVVSHNMLHTAVKNRNNEIVKLLLLNGADPNCVDEDGKTALHNVFTPSSQDKPLTTNGSDFTLVKLDIVKQLITSGVNLNAEDSEGNTALSMSVHEEDLEIIKELLKHSPDALNKGNKKSLHLAVCCSNEMLSKTIVSILYNYGFIVTTENVNDTELMHYAIKNKHLQIVEKLLQLGANPSSSYQNENHLCVAITSFNEDASKLLIKYGANVKNTQALHLAVDIENSVLVELLLNHGADPNFTGEDGKTALHYATSKKFTSAVVQDKESKPINKMLDIVSQLLAYGANIDAVDKNGQTPLFNAVNNKQLEIVQLLLKQNPDVNEKSNRKSLRVAIGFDPTLHGNIKEIVNVLISYGFDVRSEDVHDDAFLVNAIKNEYFMIAEHLLKFGANPNQAYSDSGVKRPLLHAAVEGGCYELVNLLIKNGATVNSELFHINVKKESKEIVQLLLDQGADPNYTDRMGNTALHCFVSNDRNPLSTECNIKAREEIVKLLLEKGASINAQNTMENTPLHVICDSGMRRTNETIGRILLNSGACVEIQNVAGSTPLHVAVSSFNTVMINLLLEHGVNVYARNVHRNTIFHYTSPDMIKLLLNYDLFNVFNIQVIADLVKYYSSPVRTEDYYYDVVNYADDGIEDYRYTCLQEYVIMMQELGFSFQNEIFQKNAIFILSKNVGSMAILDFKDKCSDEVKRMKKQTIDDSKVSYFDFVMKGNHQLALCLYNYSIMEVLEQGDYKAMYPVYAGVISGHFTRGKIRKKLLDKVSETFSVLFPILSDDCIHTLLGYLRNEDLSVLINM